MAAYEEALAGQPAPIGISRVKPGTFHALAVSYFASPAFRTKRPSTQYTYRNIIDRLCAEHGDKRATLMHREHVVRLIAARADKPRTANALRRSLRALMQHAVEIGMRADDPTRDVRAIRSGATAITLGRKPRFRSSSGITRWARGRGWPSRCCSTVASGVRTWSAWAVSISAMAPCLCGSKKPDDEVWIPVHPALAAIIAETPAGNLTFLVTDQGKPYSAAGFGNWFRDQCRAAGVHGCSAHGLRKAAARRLAEAGCTANEISAITGHTSLREVARYTEAADRRTLAAAAMAKVKSRTSSG